MSKVRIDLGQEKATGKMKSVLQWLLKNIVFTTLILASIVGVVAFKIVDNKSKEKVRAAKQVQVSYQQEMFSEPHTKLQYYMELENPNEDSVEATARLVAHTMDRGCSTSYKMLLENVSADSTEYLQDFLLASECGEYTPPPVVKVANGTNSTSYLVRLGSSRNRYVIKIRHKDYKVSAFEISIYVEKDKIKIEQ